jgi:hypothetical protein
MWCEGTKVLTSYRGEDHPPGRLSLGITCAFAVLFLAYALATVVSWASLPPEGLFGFCIGHRFLAGRVWLWHLRPGH